MEISLLLPDRIGSKVPESQLMKQIGLFELESLAGFEVIRGPLGL
jgi:hypothetical protein